MMSERAANVVLAVAEFFKYDRIKTRAWLHAPNPLLGGCCPIDMCYDDRLLQKLEKFVHQQLAENVPPVHEKLVRHLVPAWFIEQGEKVETRVAKPEEMLGLLRAKLLEETAELVEAIDSKNTQQMIEELVDVWDVVDTLRLLLGSAEFSKRRIEKQTERGIFDRGVVLKLDPPVPMVLLCPKCDGQHIDFGIWANVRIHRTHLCEHCGHTWRPFAYATVGVERV